MKFLLWWYYEGRPSLMFKKIAMMVRNRMLGQAAKRKSLNEFHKLNGERPIYKLPKTLTK